MCGSLVKEVRYLTLQPSNLLTGTFYAFFLSSCGQVLCPADLLATTRHKKYFVPQWLVILFPQRNWRGGYCTSRAPALFCQDHQSIDGLAKEMYAPRFYR